MNNKLSEIEKTINVIDKDKIKLIEGGDITYLLFVLKKTIENNLSVYERKLLTYWLCGQKNKSIGKKLKKSTTTISENIKNLFIKIRSKKSNKFNEVRECMSYIQDYYLNLDKIVCSRCKKEIKMNRR